MRCSTARVASSMAAEGSRTSGGASRASGRMNFTSANYNMNMIPSSRALGVLAATLFFQLGDFDFDDVRRWIMWRYYTSTTCSTSPVEDFAEYERTTGSCLLSGDREDYTLRKSSNASTRRTSTTSSTSTNSAMSCILDSSTSRCSHSQELERATSCQNRTSTSSIVFAMASEEKQWDMKSVMGNPEMERTDFASLADGFKISLVRPPDEPKNSGIKSIVNMSSMVMLDDAEIKVLDDYDELFEKYSMFCNGRWLGVQVLQDSQDLMYLQHIVYMRKPDIIIETGTYKGGLTFFFANLLEIIDREEEAFGAEKRNTAVISVDKHHPHMVFAANWFCPVCLDCRRAYETREWDLKVRFIQGLADSDETHTEVLHHMADIGYDFEAIRKPAPVADGSSAQSESAPALVPTGASNKVVIVNLDANHEYLGLLRELIYYAPYVSLNSYLIVQDAKLDKIWGVPAVSSAVERFLQLLPPFEFVIEHELKFHGYSQHIYLRRATVSIPLDYFAQVFNKAAAEENQKKLEAEQKVAAAAGAS
ncbi:unnamed protein product [Amoebophrya sp. A25]|nr:unnamed protein product [Amoebophrya sp. A25]|eukprot:GSA25T00026485001.1